MVSVAIMINGNPITARSAVKKGYKHPEYCVYECDDGSKILHNPDDGAVKLASEMLKTIKETTQEGEDE